MRRREAADVVTLTLEPVDEPLPTIAPGQFNMLWAFGIGEVPISVSRTSTTTSALVHTIRSVGPVSEALCRARRGDMVGVRGPFGTDWGVQDAARSDVVLVAGGIGLVPLRPALLQLLIERERYGQVTLLVGARSPADVLFARELTAWRRRSDVEVDVTVDVAGREWRDHVGVVTTLIPRARFDPAHTVAMVCGPELMMRYTALALNRRRSATRRIRVSMERNMKCAIVQCGHCQYGPAFVCRDGPVFPYDRVAGLLQVKEV